MASDTIDVTYVARLARLNLSAEEIAEFQSQLGQILTYVQAIRDVDVTGVEPTAHAIRVQNVFREDVSREGLAMEAILANAPQHADNQFLVPRIVE
jgi:aspartyl-tRNA(Asn)/glutamyl-tRNA(Gln) amidotransferase subunit C